MKSDTPETDNDTQAELAAWELLRDARSQRDEWKAAAQVAELAANKAKQEVCRLRDEIDSLRAMNLRLQLQLTKISAES